MKNLHAVYLFVNDVKKSSSWYSKVLNIPLTIDEDKFSLIKIGSCELCFHPADDKSPVSTGGSVAYWYVENLTEAVDLFVNHGASLYRGPIEIPESDEGICQIKDPFGNVIGLQGKYNKTSYKHDN
ncbi:MAG: hypothetical protein OXM55_01260 [Bdellovibrionales bacterium]|nr:hypothetical protein [Bdellovibrionales bacterium]